MKERPILFSGPMVRAVLEGKKTQTRRVVKPQPEGECYLVSGARGLGLAPHDKEQQIAFCPYGIPGDRLWVRETWQTSRQYDDAKPSEIPEDSSLWYAADWTSIRRLGKKPGKTRPSIFMPRWVSRLTLEVIEVRPERLQDITEGGIIAEGISLINGKGWRNPVDGRCYARAEWAFRYFWDSINAKRGFGWKVNPWVWVVSFPRADNGKENSP